MKQNNNTVGSVVAGVAGAVAVAATIALEDEKTRKNIKKMLTNAKDKALDYIDNLEKDQKKTARKNI